MNERMMIESIILFYNEYLKYPHFDGEGLGLIVIFFIIVNIPILLFTSIINNKLNKKRLSIKTLFFSNIDLLLIFLWVILLIFSDSYMGSIIFMVLPMEIIIIILMVISIIIRILISYFIENDIFSILYNYIFTIFLSYLWVNFFNMFILYIINIIYAHIIFRDKKIIFYILLFIISLLYFPIFFHIYLFDFIYIEILLFGPAILLLLSIIRLCLWYKRKIGS